MMRTRPPDDHAHVALQATTGLFGYRLGPNGRRPECRISPPGRHSVYNSTYGAVNSGQTSRSTQRIPLPSGALFFCQNRHVALSTGSGIRHSVWSDQPAASQFDTPAHRGAASPPAPLASLARRELPRSSGRGFLFQVLAS